MAMGPQETFNWLAERSQRLDEVEAQLRAANAEIQELRVALTGLRRATPLETPP